MRRRGHSLAELIVTLAFLGATVGATAAGALAATRRTTAAVARQEALAVAVLTLDSIVSAPRPVSAEALVDRWRVIWVVEAQGSGARVRVEARDTVTGQAAGVRTFWFPAPAPLEPWP